MIGALVASCVAGGAVVVSAPAAWAAGPFNVNVTTDAHDTNPGDGSCAIVPGAPQCSLRAAVEETNALPGMQAINLLPGRHLLTIEDVLTITDLVLIRGMGPAGSARRTIIEPEASGPSLVIKIEPTGWGDLRSLTIQGGRAGGISNWGVLNLVDSTVQRNSFYGGVMNSGEASISNSTIRDNESSDRGGPAAIGGGITNYPPHGDRPYSELRLTNVTVSGNRANRDGGGMYFGWRTRAHLNNVTITNNTAGHERGTSSEFNGGGIYVSPPVATHPPPSVVLKNTIVAGNFDVSATPSHAPDCWNRGVLTSQGYNLVANSAECPFTRATGDRQGTSAAPINPARVLEPLIRNNGRESDTHALIPGSPAIDTGSPATFNGTNPSFCDRADQRGVVRPVDGNGDAQARCDIGAFEFIRFPTMGIGDVSTLEGSQTKTMNFVVSLSTKSLQTITVDYSTADGTAVAGADYVGAKGRLTFAAGQVSRTISVTLLGDAKTEGSETLSVVLSDAVHAELADKQATGTIVDDD